MNPSHPVISIFGSSRPQEGEEEYQIAYETGKLLAEAGFTICNGGYGGIMEASAKGAKDGGGSTIGIVSAYFSKNANPYIDRKIVTELMTDRLLKLIDLGDGFVVLKGSTGTLLELAAVWEFVHKGVIAKKPIVLIGSFWESVVATLRRALTDEGKEQASALVTIVPSSRECVKYLSNHFKIQ